MNLIDRFIWYLQKNTQSHEHTRLTPSTPGQMDFARELEQELKAVGLQEVLLDSKGYLMATLPANTAEQRPVVGFIAHLDTSPDLSGENVLPQRVPSYAGGDILLNADEGIVLSPEQFPELLNYIGQDIVCTNGKTLLGADDKAGIAEIVSAMEYLVAHPEIKHGKIRVAFTPDEEIGRGADHFDVKAFGADFAYTVDGGEIGELEYENFYAASAKIAFKGCNVHPGYAKHKMLNAIRVANQFMGMLPPHETPEQTEGYEGFYHPTDFNGTVESTVINCIIRDHDRDRFECRKKEMQRLVNKINDEYGSSVATLEMKDQYFNMLEKINPDNMHVVRLAESAMMEVGVTPKVCPVRGGTDGARLSFLGLPCPNIFTGGHNFHGRYEFIPIPSMEKAVQVIVKIAEISSINS